MLSFDSISGGAPILSSVFLHPWKETRVVCAIGGRRYVVNPAILNWSSNSYQHFSDISHEQILHQIIQMKLFSFKLLVLNYLIDSLPIIKGLINQSLVWTILPHFFSNKKSSSEVSIIRQDSLLVSVVLVVRYYANSTCSILSSASAVSLLVELSLLHISQIKPLQRDSFIG